MKRFFGILGNAVCSTFAFIASGRIPFIARTPRLARFFGVLDKAIYCTATMSAGICLNQWINGKRIDFDVVERGCLLFFFVGFMLGSYKGNSSLRAAQLQSRDCVVTQS